MIARGSAGRDSTTSTGITHMAKTNTLRHPKIFLLADLLDAEPWAALGLMEAFWDWVHQNVRDGDISNFSPSAIADGVAWRRKPSDLIHLLRESGWIDELENGTLYVHDYHDHAPDYVRKHLERFGKDFANGFPARMPKEGYKKAGFVSPNIVPYTHSVEPPSRQKPPDNQRLARQRRDNGSTKPPPEPGFVATRAREAQPNPRKEGEILPMGTQLGDLPEPDDEQVETSGRVRQSQKPPDLASPEGESGFKRLADEVMKLGGKPPNEPDPEVERRRAEIRRQRKAAGDGG